MPEEGTVGVEEAAAILAVPQDRVHEMVEEGLLDPLPGDGPPRFAETAVRAVHNLGG